MADPYVAVSDLRASFPDIADDERFPDELLAGLVTEFEEKLEEDKGFAMVRREVTGEQHRRTSAVSSIVLNHIEVALDSVVLSIDGRSIAAARFDVDGPAGILDFDANLGPGVFSVDYEHGLAEASAAVRRATGLYVWREAMAQKNPNSGNTYLRTNTDLGITERESTADPEAGRLTGWLDVDRICKGIRSRRDHAVHGR